MYIFYLCGYTKYIYIFSKGKEFDKPNFGIAVGKKLGNAVVRNKFKRQFRNIVDKNRFLFKNNNNYIIMIKREANNASFSELETDLIRATTVTVRGVCSGSY